MSCRCLLNGTDFTFIWKIRYITLWNELKQDIISSQTFYADTLYGTQWDLCLKRNPEIQSFDLFLRRADQDDGPEEIRLNLSINVLYETNICRKLNIKEVLTVRRDGSFIIPNILTQDEIANFPSMLSQDSLLIFQCFLKDSIDRMPQVCKSVTEVDVERVSFVWNTSTSADDLRKLSINAMSILNQAPPLDISVYTATINGEKSLRFSFDAQEVLGIENNLVVVIKITMLSDSGKTCPSPLQCLYSFKSVDDAIWEFPLYFKVSHFEEFCKSLTFSFDLQFSYGKLSSKIEETKFVPGFMALRNVNCLHSEDFLPMYKDGHFFNVTLRVGDRTFPAHKDILCIRSPVFESIILEHEEAQEITVSDLDAETLDIFLSFLYSSMSLELMQSHFPNLVGDHWTLFKKLYAAVIQYEVTKLKNVCSIFLASNVNSQNVLECMKLAELHNDNAVKVAAHNYFTTYASEIINSDAFKNLLRLN